MRTDQKSGRYKEGNDRVAETAKTLLSLVGTGGLIVAAAVAPGVLIALSAVLAEKTRLPERKIYQALRYADKKQWLKIVETKDGIAVALTPRGRRRTEVAPLTQPLQDPAWDGKWRMVIFDVPDKKKKVRDSLRWLLRKLGFRQLQESVWITPWKCDMHIGAARELFGLGRSLRLVTAQSFEGEEEFLAKYDLKR